MMWFSYCLLLVDIEAYIINHALLGFLSMM